MKRGIIMKRFMKEEVRMMEKGTKRKILMKKKFKVKMKFQMRHLKIIKFEETE